MFWKLSEPTPNGPMAARLFLELADVKLSYTTLQQEVEDHPDYPSLLSVSDVFTKYQIDNITASFAPADMMKIPPPYITQIKGAKSDMVYFTVVKKFTSEAVLAFDPEERKWKKYSALEFMDRTNGTVLLAEPEAHSGERDYKQIRREERHYRFSLYALPLLLLTALVMVNIQSFRHTGQAALIPGFYTVLSAIGVLSGALLIWYELDRHNPIVQQLCKGSRRVNCNAILQSDAARIGGVSWSTIGLSYFSGQFLFILSQGTISSTMQAVTGIISVLALPYVFYSVYFQWRIAKQWCSLCLTVQALLILQASLALSQADKLVLYFSLAALVVYGLIIAASFLAATLLVPVLKKGKRARAFRNQLKRLKYEPAVFKAVLHKQRNVHEGAAGLGIVLGNPNAVNRILKVCNPYCGPCAKAHAPIEALLESNPDIQLQIIFTAANDDEDEQKWPVSHLLAIAADNNEVITKQALDDWYLAQDKNYEQFASRYPFADGMPQQGDKIAAMHEWCINAGIAHTPTIFFNNHELPNIYNIHDLKNFLSA